MEEKIIMFTEALAMMIVLVNLMQSTQPCHPERSEGPMHLACSTEMLQVISNAVKARRLNLTTEN
jgi:hypothetical protein